MRKQLKRTMRRHRRKIAVAGWSIAGFLLVFCVLTVQLSTTGVQNTPRPVSLIKSEDTSEVADPWHVRTASAGDAYSADAIDDRPFDELPRFDSFMPSGIATESEATEFEDVESGTPMSKDSRYVPADQELDHFDNIELQPLSQLPQEYRLEDRMGRYSDDYPSFEAPKPLPGRVSWRQDGMIFR